MHSLVEAAFADEEKEGGNGGVHDQAINCRSTSNDIFGQTPSSCTTQTLPAV